jgi:deoxyribonuclease-4
MLPVHTDLRHALDGRIRLGKDREQSVDEGVARMMRIGCHLSVAKGYPAAVREAPKLGANCFQYFTKNPRGFRGQKPLNTEEAATGRQLLEEFDVISIGHAPYLINLASGDDELFQLSIDALRQDLVIAEARGSHGVVVHCGKPKELGLDYGIARMQEGLTRVLEAAVPASVPILLENTAGQGSEIGYTIDQLLAIAEPFAANQVGFCFDTQHAFAAGILSLEDPRGSAGFNHPAYLARLQAIHLNDSKVSFGAKRDRHELLGQGFMGQSTLLNIVTDPRLAHVPFYLETPVKDQSQYAEEIATLRQWLPAS